MLRTGLGSAPAWKALRSTKSFVHSTARCHALIFAVCCREVSAEEYAAWEPVFQRAKTALQDRDAQLDAAAELIEKDLLLLGATAIEDKLQEVGPAGPICKAVMTPT